jgi:hypothetical protein
MSELSSREEKSSLRRALCVSADLNLDSMDSIEGDPTEFSVDTDRIQVEDTTFDNIDDRGCFFDLEKPVVPIDEIEEVSVTELYQLAAKMQLAIANGREIGPPDHRRTHAHTERDITRRQRRHSKRVIPFLKTLSTHPRHKQARTPNLYDEMVGYADRVA